MKTKKHFLLAVFFFFCFSGFSQDHLKFKGIPINGTIANFVNELSKQDYIITNTAIDSITLKGTFVGELSRIVVEAGRAGNLLYKVTVYLPPRDNWMSLTKRYDEILKEMTIKYRKSTPFYYFFEPYYNGDGKEMEALSRGKITFTDFWTNNSGGEILSIIESKEISIEYEDDLNRKIIETDKKNIINKDI